MSLQDKLRLHLSDKRASWSADGLVADAPGERWVAVPSALTSAALLDAFESARAAGVRLTLVHEGAPSAPAQRSAARLGVTLVEASLLPEPAAAAEPTTLALPLPEPEVLLPAHVAAPPEPLSVPALPWDPTEPVPEIVTSFQPTPLELLALPWHASGPLEDHVEVTESPRLRRFSAPHPTSDLHPHANWSLPWPKPVSPEEALSIADPRVWGSVERLAAMRADLAGGVFTPAARGRPTLDNKA